MKYLNVLMIAFIGFGLMSCNPKFYTPNTQNVSLISQKGETNLTLAGNANQVEFQGAYGVSNGFAMIANGGLFIPSDLDNGNGGSGKFLEIGGGYFTPVSDQFVFETYGLVGFGGFENHLPSTAGSTPNTKGKISANIFRVGIQPNFGFKSRYFSAALSSRFVNLSYNDIKGDLIFEGVNQVDYLTDHNSNFLIEPAMTIRGGLDKIKVQVQYLYSFNLTTSDFRQDESILTLGLNFNF